MHVQHREQHRTDRIGWLRAAVLGTNDGISDLVNSGWGKSPRLRVRAISMACMDVRDKLAALGLVPREK